MSLFRYAYFTLDMDGVNSLKTYCDNTTRRARVLEYVVSSSRVLVAQLELIRAISTAKKDDGSWSIYTNQRVNSISIKEAINEISRTSRSTGRGRHRLG